MKTLFLRWVLFAVLMTVGVSGSARAQNAGLVTADPMLAQSAQAAVQKMGLEMMKGNFKYGHERMYPRWKRRLAKRYGGMERLEEGLAKSADKQVQLGMMVSGFHADRPTSFFSVWRSKKRDPKTGAVVQDATGREVIVEHWLAVVPTTTQVKLMDPQTKKLRTLEERSYTIAIAEKGTHNWYFLTGMKPRIQDLRSLFPSLPPEEKDLGLPPSSAREIK